MKTRITLVLALVLTLSSTISAQEYVPQFENLTLSNGLQVTLHHDSTVSFVTLNMSYRAGSSRDPKGKTGVANIAGEALLTGTEAYPREELLRLRTEGDVSIRAQTTVDWCSIASVFPAGQLELALAIEADRMSNATSTATVEVFDAIVAVIKREHERRARKPLATLMQQIYDELYGEDHPYRHATLGYSADLEKLKVGDVRDFLKRYMTPSNACLTIGGNFDPAKMASLVSTAFERIPAGVMSRWQSLPDEFTPYGQAAFNREDRIDFNQLHLIFPTVRIGHADDPALKVLATLLNGSQNSLLRKNIVDANPLIINAEVYQSAQEIGGHFWISIAVKPDMRLQSIYTQVMQLLTSVAEEGVTEEDVLAARNHVAMDFYTPLEALYGFGGRSDLLNLGMLYADNPLFHFDLYHLQQGVTSADLRRMAARYLTSGNQLIVSCIPMGKTEYAVTP